MVERSSLLKRGRKIAITGKGGSGKTMLTAIMTRVLARNGALRILAIDADSAVNLPYALGTRVHKTVADIRRQIIQDPKMKRQMENRHIRDVMAEALEPGKGFDVLVMGRPEGPGCYCSINDLLRYGIDRLSQEFDMTLIDCEAGPEQVNRRVVESVNVLIIVTDASIRGVRVASSIAEVVRSDEAMSHTLAGLVINRLKGDDSAVTESAKEWGLEIFGRIPEDESVTEYDSVGRPLIDLPDTALSVIAVREILERLVY